jgi:hypothetical protein
LETPGWFAGKGREVLETVAAVGKVVHRILAIPSQISLPADFLFGLIVFQCRIWCFGRVMSKVYVSLANEV